MQSGKGDIMQVEKSLRPRVLVVDDDPLSRTIVSRKLASLASIVEACDGYEAIAKLQSDDVHLVIIDLDMPGISGLDVIRHMRAQPVLRSIPIIVLTGNEIDGLQQSLMAGVTSALRKPLDWQAFGEHVRHVLELAFRAGHLASRDPLTGLANRRVFEDRLRAAVTRASPDTAVAIHILDLDHFKQVNDTLGHAAGDELLVDVAHRLNAVAFECSCIARLGGDEFAILQPLPGGAPVAAAQALARAVIASVGEAYDLSFGTARIGVSVGIELVREDKSSAETLLRHADAALYHAKRNGRGAVCVRGLALAEAT
jgi:diguanylate cyclase (GGDEF)-like protein